MVITNRAPAIKLALEEIDRHPDTYSTTEAQYDMLDKLISSNQLQEQRKKWTGKKRYIWETVRMSKSTFRDILTALIPARFIGDGSSKFRTTQIFEKGSCVLKPAYLDEIGYKRKAQAARKQTTAADTSQNTASEHDASAAQDHESHVSSGGSSSVVLLDGRTSSQEHSPVPHDETGTADADASAREHDQNAAKAIAARQAETPQMHQASVKAQSQITGSKRTHEDPSVDVPRSSKILKLSAHGPGSLRPTNESLSTSEFRRPLESDIAAVDQSKRSHRAELGIPESSNGSTAMGMARAAQSRRERKYKTESNPLDLYKGSKVFDRSKCFGVDPRDVSNKLGWIRDQVRVWSQSLLDGTGVDEKSCALLAMSPSRELETFYKRAFGDQWQMQSLSIISSENFTASKLIECCLYAAVYKVMFEDRLPWPTPDEIDDRHEDMNPFLNQIVVDATTGRHDEGVSMRTIVWRAANQQFRNRDFIDFNVSRVADERATTVMHAMQKQFQSLGATNVTDANDTADFWEDLTYQLGDILQEALVIRGLISTSREVYDHQWFPNGSKMLPKITKGMVAGEVLTKVMFCQTPAIWIKKREQDQWELACPAYVWHTKS